MPAGKATVRKYDDVLFIEVDEIESNTEWRVIALGIILIWSNQRWASHDEIRKCMESLLRIWAITVAYNILSYIAEDLSNYRGWYYNELYEFIKIY